MKRSRDSTRRSKQAKLSTQCNSSLIGKLTRTGWLSENATLAYLLRGEIKGNYGRATKEGIRCSCCEKLFQVTAFEKHCGITLHRASDNVCEYDPLRQLAGKSIKALHGLYLQEKLSGSQDSANESKLRDVSESWDQIADINNTLHGVSGNIPEHSEMKVARKPAGKSMVILQNINGPTLRQESADASSDPADEACEPVDKARDPAGEIHDESEIENHITDNDNTCQFCGSGGDFIACETPYCPEVCHINCAQEKVDPLYCQKCLCGTCGQDFWHLGDIEKPALICCSLCGEKSHTLCLLEDQESLDFSKVSEWFCQYTCMQTFSRLTKLVESQEIGSKIGMTWSLLRPRSPGIICQELAPARNAARTAVHRKLNRAVNLLESYFPGTEVSNAVRNVRSDVKAFDLGNFYTILMEDGGVDIAAIVFRIHTWEVAEMPFCATVAARRQEGLCRLAMISLETILKEIKVQYLVIHSPPALIQIWTDRFGFQVVDSECYFKKLCYSDFVGISFLRIPATSLMWKKIQHGD